MTSSIEVINVKSFSRKNECPVRLKHLICFLQTIYSLRHHMDSKIKDSRRLRHILVIIAFQMATFPTSPPLVNVNYIYLYWAS